LTIVVISVLNSKNRFALIIHSAKFLLAAEVAEVVVVVVVVGINSEVLAVLPWL
jgi:hypothetical protein